MAQCDLEFIVANHKIMNSRAISLEIGRTPAAVRSVAHRLGLSDKRKIPLRPWLTREVEYLKKWYPIIGKAACAKVLRRSLSSIYYYAKMHNLTRPKTHSHNWINLAKLSLPYGLKVIRFIGKGRKGHSVWQLSCHCGNLFMATANNVTKCRKSCGCINHKRVPGSKFGNRRVA